MMSELSTKIYVLIGVESHVFRLTLRLFRSAFCVNGKACFQHMQQTEEKVHKHTGYFWLSCTDLISALSCYTFVAVDSMEFLYLSLCFAYLLSLLKKFNSLKIGAGS